MLEYADKLGILSFYCFMQRCECPQNSEALFQPLAAVSSAAPCAPASSSALRANIARCFTRSALAFGPRQGALPPITPARELSSLDLPPSLRTMPPRQLVRASREHCAFLYALRAPRATLGGSAPYNPCQGTEFPGPSAFAQNHAAPPARPRSARTLRAALCAPRMRSGYVRGLCPL